MSSTKRAVRWLAGCEGGPCDNGYELVATSDCLVQGQQVTDAATLSGIAVGPGEVFVRVPKTLILDMAQRMTAEGEQ